MYENKKQYIESIIKAHEAKRSKYDKDYRIGSIKNWLGGLIIIGSTLIPGTALLKIFGSLAKVSPAAAKLIPAITSIIIKNIKFSKPLLKQIVENALKKAVLEGGVYGGIYGLGYSVQQDKNFKETVETITDSVINGIIFNVLLSSAVLTGKLIFKGKNILYNFDRRKDWGVVFKKASGNPELAIKTLLKYQKGFVPKVIYKKGIGYIDLIWGDSTGGVNHIIKRRNKQNINGIEFVKKILLLLQNGKVSIKKGHLGRKYVNNSNNEIVIRTDFNKKRRNWIVSAYKKDSGVPSKAMSERRPLNNTYADGQVISPSDLLKAPYNILYLINKIFNKKMINFDKFVAKRLAASAPMSNPYDISRYSNFTNILDYTDNITLKTKFFNSQLVNVLKKIYIYLTAETNRTPDIVSNYSEMAPSQTTNMKKVINNFDKSAIKRLAAWKPKSKPYVDSRIHFTTELNRLVGILKAKNIFVNSRLINISQKKLKKLLLFLLLNKIINNRKNNRKKINIGFGNNFSMQTQINNDLNNGQTLNSFKTFKQNTPLKYNYGKNEVSTNNNMQFQNEKMPSLYRGSTIRPQQLSANNGQSILNSGSNVPIRDIKYNNLPEIQPMNIPLENNPIFNFGSTNYTRGNTTAINNGNNFDMNGVLKLSMKILEQYLSGRTGQGSLKTQPQQYYEFIPSDY